MMGLRNDLLFAACQLPSPRQSRAEPREPRDWNYVLDAADRQGVGPLLHVWLQGHAATSVPGEAAARLYDLYWTHHFRNRILLSELDRVCHAAASAGFPIIALKGAALAADCYSTPALRPMSDLDLLVREADVERMDPLLQALGYWRERSATSSYVDDPWLDQASHDHVWTTKRDGVEVIVEYRAAALRTTFGRIGDLDRTLVGELRAYTNAMWARAAPAGGDPSAGLQLSREDLLLHVASHLAAQHGDFRLIWLHDLARIVVQPPGRLDWEYVCATARSLRIAAPTWAALSAAARWLDAPVDLAVLDRLRDITVSGGGSLAQRWERRRLNAHVAALGDADLARPEAARWPLAVALGRMRGWRPRIRTVRWAVLPSRTYLKRYGSEAGLRGYVTTWTRRSLGAAARFLSPRR
jgi:hypothetical protein